MNNSSATNVRDLFERVPPASQEAEQGVLGCILLDNEGLHSALEVLNAKDFYREGHRVIYNGFLALSERGEPIDILTLVEELRKSDRLERAGGPAYVAGLPDLVPAAAHVGSYARIVRDKSILRSLISTAQEITARAYEDTGEVEQFLDEAEAAIFDVADRKIRAGFVGMHDLVRSTFKTLESLAERGDSVTGVPTGFSELDDITAGFQPGDLVVIAGRPGMGKTALALNIIRNAAIDGQVPGAMYSLEMNKEQLAIRLFCSEARIDSRDVRRGRIVKDDWDKITRAANILQSAPIYIDDTPGISVMEMKAKSRRLKSEHNIGLVVVDYLQLMGGRQGRETNREQEIADISRSLKGMAKELALPVVALSQLNRAVETREDKRPRLSDLRESGAIEQDADLILFLYRDIFYDPDTKDKNMTELIVGKQRNGPVGTVNLTFIEKYTRFENWISETSGLGPEN